MIRRWLGGLALILLAGACAHTDEEDGGEKRFEDLARGLKVEHDPELDTLPPPVRDAWKHYGAVRLAVRMGLKGKNAEHEPFVAEYVARQELARRWQQLRPASSVQGGEALDAMVQLVERGLVDEYVLLHFAAPGWRVTLQRGLKLDVATYNRFVGSHAFAAHEPWRPFAFHDPSGHGALNVVGPPASLPPSPLLTDTGQCGELLPSLTRWADDVQRRLEQVRGRGAHPLAADASGELILSLAALQDRGGEKEVVAEWVDPRLYEVVFTLGFCLVELDRSPEAVAPLRVAVELAPVMPNPQLELAQALIGARELDEAYRIARRLAGKGGSPEHRAAGLRTMGYIEIERGQLDLAEATFRASLRLDPGSEMARNELDYIRQQRGEAKAEAPTDVPGVKVKSLRELMEEAQKKRPDDDDTPAPDAQPP